MKNGPGHLPGPFCLYLCSAHTMYCPRHVNGFTERSLFTLSLGADSSCSAYSSTRKSIISWRLVGHRPAILPSCSWRTLIAQ